ncbi:hypothetical protein [Aestuariibacter sp. A3R04]|uniref:hypothetical protein n=1 Tax=Aestuariibacter sp. A3R04 TaxID=2841571 RepID=UPI001C090691|nr:hypothetical protein [Aestuariibacter sp. A3R04]MBU3020387.1 hypothetical protein [Aestuariibacter sp. A3R04]
MPKQLKSQQMAQLSRLNFDVLLALRILFSGGVSDAAFKEDITLLARNPEQYLTQVKASWVAFIYESLAMYVQKNRDQGEMMIEQLLVSVQQVRSASIAYQRHADILQHVATNTYDSKSNNIEWRRALLSVLLSFATLKPEP